MKKLLTLLTMALIAICANAQAVIAGVDWTQKSEWDGGWESSNAKVASVTNGTVKGINAGTATITCTSTKTGRQALVPHSWCR